MLPADIIKRYRFRKGSDFRLADIDPSAKGGLDLDKERGNAMLAEGAKRLGALLDPAAPPDA